MQGKEGRVGYLSFLTRITPDCDCVPWSDASIVPDIGILASKDPVAIDAAACDLVNLQEGFAESFLSTHRHKGEDKFSGMRPNTDGKRQSRYAEELGMGSREYSWSGSELFSPFVGSNLFFSPCVLPAYMPGGDFPERSETFPYQR